MNIDERIAEHEEMLKQAKRHNKDGKFGGDENHIKFLLDSFKAEKKRQEGMRTTSKKEKTTQKEEQE